MIWIIAVLFLFLAVALIALMLKLSSQVNERLNQMTQSVQEANSVIGQNLGNTAQIFGNVQESLGKLKESNDRIYEISKDISRLQELLRVPKFRGQIGETLLEGILSQVLPKEYVKMQYRFKTGDAVDAVIVLGERLVPIDAKFTLENFQKMLDAPDEQEKAACKKKFVQDVKNRIDEIAVKYILPDEHTYDFAFMYIPAENVYYEVIIKEDLLSYCMSKKIIPISPNTFYAYLQVICLGLKGLKVQENAKEILKSLATLSQEMIRFREEFGLLGTHLANASRKYDDSAKKLERFADRLHTVQDTKKLTDEP